jgi:ABC-type branched-subunit amino acid transport system ATPase component
MEPSASQRTTPAPRAILQVDGLRVSFGGLTAVNGLSFGIEEGRITGLIGPNGSGKTTAFNLISGVIRPDAGRVILAGQNVAGWPPHRIAALGLARTYQISRVFGQMTVWENMLVGARRPPRAAADQATDLLARVNLLDKKDALGADLSYGQAKLLEIVRALMLDPRILLLDEPFAGVNPTMGQTVLAELRTLHQQGLTILIIDHAMTIIMSLCERILVMDMGSLIADGPPAEIQGNEQVLEAYFGRGAAEVGS